MLLKLFDITPSRKEILQYQNIDPKAELQKRIIEYMLEAEKIFNETARPEFIIKEISKDQFSDIYRGSGKNENDTPVEIIYPKAEYLSLFILTIGESFVTEIDAAYKNNEPVLAYMLDSIGSVSVEKGVSMFEKEIEKKHSGHKNFKVLAYSPGYCGWHISAQQQIFQFLSPGKINVELNDSFLMTPLKSVTGVFLGGEKEIHLFINNYSFCKECKTFTCISRKKSLF